MVSHKGGHLLDDMTQLAQDIIDGNRRALARAITLVESTRPDHREQAVALLEALRAKTDREALRIGLSGTPGVGKSTFTEAFGMMLLERGLRVAVLAVDPSSARSGGSILGDKTRMERLSREPNAFIRPSPSQTTLGGVARRTREAIALCEAAGFDVILVETVGVGQSETMVADMCDIFLLLLAPAGGDELQGVKRGIMEIADIILINKADGDLKPAAMRTVNDYRGALRLLRKRPQDAPGFPKVLPVSALTGEGVEQAWKEINTLADWRKGNGTWNRIRTRQEESRFEDELRREVLARLDRDDRIRTLRERLRDRVSARQISPEAAARQVLDVLDSGTQDKE